MDDRDFLKSARVLSSDHSLRILRFLSNEGWKIASEVSTALDIHTSTASKYLGELHRTGHLERRLRKTGRRSAFEYSLKSPTLRLQLDLTEYTELDGSEIWCACLDFFHRLIDQGTRMGFSDLRDKISDLVQKLKAETGIEKICLYDPWCDVKVSAHLVKKMIDEGRLDESVSAAKGMSHLMFSALRTLLEEVMGEMATETIFSSVLDDSDPDQIRIFEQIGIAEGLERGFANGR